MLDLKGAGQFYSFHPVLLELCDRNIYATLILGYLFAQENFRDKEGWEFEHDLTAVNVRTLQKQLGISPKTIAKALKLLHSKKYIILTAIQDKANEHHQPTNFAQINDAVLQPLINAHVECRNKKKLKEKSTVPKAEQEIPKKNNVIDFGDGTSF